jgi:predicted dehydrogenase
VGARGGLRRKKLDRGGGSHTLILNDSEEGPSKVWNPVFPNTLIFDEEFGGFMALIENFAECIRGREKPLVTGWDGLKAYEMVVATHRSIREKARIALPLSTKKDGIHHV